MVTRTADPGVGASAPLTVALHAALRSGDGRELDGLAVVRPRDERDELMALLTIHDMWTAPLWVTDGIEEHQSHPGVVSVKRRLEDALIARLEERRAGDPPGAGPDEPAAAIRRISAVDLLPAVYRWIADDASWEELVRFLALEGGPDAGFDDLVATAQVGLRGGPKVALARNYWDELGRGTLAGVHTVLHDRLVEATRMPRVPRSGMPVGALERTAIGGVLATNRRLQPEMIGALGVVELQAGPRCRAVVRALERLDAPEGAFPFYREHADADPRHGRDWLEEAVTPLAEELPAWGPRLVAGARWRHEVNARFFSEVEPLVRPRT